MREEHSCKGSSTGKVVKRQLGPLGARAVGERLGWRERVRWDSIGRGLTGLSFYQEHYPERVGAEEAGATL